MVGAVAHFLPERSSPCDVPFRTDLVAASRSPLSSPSFCSSGRSFGPNPSAPSSPFRHVPACTALAVVARVPLSLFTFRPPDPCFGPLSDDALGRSCGPTSVLAATPGHLPSLCGSFLPLPLQALRPPPPDPPAILPVVVIVCQVADPLVVVSRDTTSVPALFTPLGRRVIAVGVARRVAKSLLSSPLPELHCLLACCRVTRSACS